MSNVRTEVTGLLRRYFEAFTEGLADAPAETRAELARTFAFRDAPHDPSALAALEASLPTPLPPALRALLSIGHFPAIEAFEFVLPGVAPPEPLAEFSRLLVNPALSVCGYLQFGYGPCGDPLCLDFAVLSAPSGFPVVVFNHDVIPQQAWASRSSLSPFAVPVASSFSAFLAGLCTGTTAPPWGSAG